jgi:hypothetical protein
MSRREFKGPDARIRLKELGFTQEEMHQAIWAAETRRSMITDLHPRNFRGLVFWGELSQVIRAIKLPDAWKARDLRGMPLTISPDGKIAITPWSGDENTGLSNLTPKTRGAHGAVAVRAIDRNLWLLEGLKGWERRDVIADDLSLWGLLTFHRPRRLISAEVSLPSAIDETGHVYGWAERIILDPLTFDPSSRLWVPEDEPEIDVDVVRKTS